MIEYILQYILYGKELQIELEKECTIKWFVIELGEQKPDKDIDWLLLAVCYFQFNWNIF